MWTRVLTLLAQRGLPLRLFALNLIILFLINYIIYWRILLTIWCPWKLVGAKCLIVNSSNIWFTWQAESQKAAQAEICWLVSPGISQVPTPLDPTFTMTQLNSVFSLESCFQTWQSSARVTENIILLFSQALLFSQCPLNNKSFLVFWLETALHT